MSISASVLSENRAKSSDPSNKNKTMKRLLAFSKWGLKQESNFKIYNNPTSLLQKIEISIINKFQTLTFNKLKNGLNSRLTRLEETLKKESKNSS